MPSTQVYRLTNYNGRNKEFRSCLTSIVSGRKSKITISTNSDVTHSSWSLCRVSASTGVFPQKMASSLSSWASWSVSINWPLSTRRGDQRGWTHVVWLCLRTASIPLLLYGLSSCSCSYDQSKTSMIAMINSSPVLHYRKTSMIAMINSSPVLHYRKTSMIAMINSSPVLHDFTVSNNFGLKMGHFQSVIFLSILVILQHQIYDWTGNRAGKLGKVREKNYGPGKVRNFVFLLKVWEFLLKYRLPWKFVVIFVDYQELLSWYSPIWTCTCDFARNRFCIVFKCFIFSIKTMRISYKLSYSRLLLGFV